jgi:transposase-like protein
MSDCELSGAQEKAIEALLAGKSVTEAAIAAGVDRTTVHRWLKDVRFEVALGRARRELREARKAN